MGKLWCFLNGLPNFTRKITFTKILFALFHSHSFIHTLTEKGLLELVSNYSMIYHSDMNDNIISRLPFFIEKKSTFPYF